MAVERFEVPARIIITTFEGELDKKLTQKQKTEMALAVENRLNKVAGIRYVPLQALVGVRVHITEEPK